MTITDKVLGSDLMGSIKRESSLSGIDPAELVRQCVQEQLPALEARRLHSRYCEWGQQALDLHDRQIKEIRAAFPSSPKSVPSAPEDVREYVQSVAKLKDRHLRELAEHWERLDPSEDRGPRTEEAS